MKIIVLIFIVLILASLGSALYFLVKDKGNSTRTAKALTPISDIHASPDYRRHLAEVLMGRALRDAVGRCKAA